MAARDRNWDSGSGGGVGPSGPPPPGQGPGDAWSVIGYLLAGLLVYGGLGLLLDRWLGTEFFTLLGLVLGGGLGIYLVHVRYGRR
jgi:ATP synthase protein I